MGSTKEGSKKFQIVKWSMPTMFLPFVLTLARVAVPCAAAFFMFSPFFGDIFQVTQDI